MENKALKVCIPNSTVECLSINYTPDHWPSSGECNIHVLHIQKPWGGFSDRKWYEDQMKIYGTFQSILKPHEDNWIECDCIASLNPCIYNEFEIAINGLLICFKEFKIKKLKKELDIKTQITTCNAKIEGGGVSANGSHRGYNLFLDLPKGKAELLQIQRKRERQKLFDRFNYKIIKDLYKNKFFKLFGNKCFRCGHPDDLEIDHHIPLALGGHLVPGNLVALCKLCNNLKLDKHPEEFYSKEKLASVQPLLESQQFGIFDFNFDYEYWMKDHRGYLISLGIDPSVVDEIFTNDNHYYYISPPSNQVHMVCTLTADEHGNWITKTELIDNRKQTDMD